MSRDPAEAAELERLRLLVELRRYAEAEPALRDLLAHEPHDDAVLVLLSSVLVSLGRHDEALELAERAVAAAPGDSSVHLARCRALLELGRHDDAVSAAQEVVRLAPEDWRSHVALGSALREGPRPRLRSALAAAQEAVRLAPHESSVHNLLGLCLDDRGRRRDARRAFQEAVRVDPTDAYALNNLAACDMRRGRLGSGTRMLTTALASDSADPALRRNFNAVAGLMLWRCLVLVPFWAFAFFGLQQEGVGWPVRTLALLLVVPSYLLVSAQLFFRLPRGVRSSWRGMVQGLDRPRRGMLAFLVGSTVLLAGMAVPHWTVAQLAFVALYYSVLVAVGLTVLVFAAKGLAEFPRNLRRLFWPARRR